MAPSALVRSLSLCLSSIKCNVGVVNPIARHAACAGGHHPGIFGMLDHTRRCRSGRFVRKACRSRSCLPSCARRCRLSGRTPSCIPPGRLLDYTHATGAGARIRTLLSALTVWGMGISIADRHLRSTRNLGCLDAAYQPSAPSGLTCELEGVHAANGNMATCVRTAIYMHSMAAWTAWRLGGTMAAVDGFGGGWRRRGSTVMRAISAYDDGRCRWRCADCAVADTASAGQPGTRRLGPVRH